MARRLLFVGNIDDLEILAAQQAARYVPGSDYVFGEFADIKDMPEAGLMWFDLFYCYDRAKLTAKQRYAHKEYIKLTPINEIARQMGVDWHTVKSYITQAVAALDALGPGGLGCWTVFIEMTGGWTEVVTHLREKRADEQELSLTPK